MTEPVPHLMRDLWKGANGLPAPWIAQTDDNGVPVFSINDEQLRQKCFREDRCGICGRKNNRFRWFVGGPHQGFHPQGAYLDPPMHSECLHYALKVCPHLAAEKYGKLVARKIAAKIGLADELLSDNSLQANERLEIFIAIKCDRHRLIRGNIAEQVPAARARGVVIEGITSAQPKRPYREIEIWRHGKLEHHLTERGDIDLLVTEMQEWAISNVEKHMGKTDG